MTTTYGYIRTSRQRIQGTAGNDPEAQDQQLRQEGVPRGQHPPRRRGRHHEGRGDTVDQPLPLRLIRGMALCLADSLISCGGFDPVDQMDRYLLWVKKGTSAALGSASTSA